MLREVLALEDGQARPAMSTVFSAPRGTFAADLLGAAHPGRPDPARVAAALPVPLVDPTDPAAAQLAAAQPRAGAPGRGDHGPARPRGPAGPGAGRARRGRPGRRARRARRGGRRRSRRLAHRLVPGRRGALHATRPRPSRAFDRAYLTFPGELAPKLALAVAAECAGDDERARRYYALLARIEPSLADAAFGLARTALRAGDRATAVAALDAVPDTSSRHVAAQLAAIDATLAGRTGPEIGDADLRAAAARVPGLPLDPGTAEQVRTALFAAAVELVSGNGGHGDRPPLLGHAWQERDLRLALERSLRTSARLCSDVQERVLLVDRANAARPRTWT